MLYIQYFWYLPIKDKTMIRNIYQKINFQNTGYWSLLENLNKKTYNIKQQNKYVIIVLSCNKMQIQ